VGELVGEVVHASERRTALRGGQSAVKKVKTLGPHQPRCQIKPTAVNPA
jgi:hypothetical protein